MVINYYTLRGLNVIHNEILEELVPSLKVVLLY